MNFAAPSSLTLAVSLCMSLLSASGAQAYCVAHECSLDAPGGERCVRDAQTGCSMEGVALTRPNGCIQFAVQHGAGTSLGISDAAFEEAITAAFETWAEVDCGDGDSPSIEVRSVGSVPIDEPFSCLSVPSVNVDTWFMSDRLAGQDAITANSGATAGLTRPSFIVEDGEVFDADVMLNELWFLVQREENIEDFLHVVAMHEAGHALGLAHSLEEDALMHRDYRVTKDRTLTADDIDGVCALFPPMSLDCDSPSKLPAAFDEAACAAEHQRREEEPTMPAQSRANDSGCSVGRVMKSGPCELSWLGGLLGSLLATAFWRARRRQLALAMSLTALLGCSRPAAESDPAPAAPVGDPELLARVADLSAVCQLDEGTGRLECQNAADEELASSFLSGQRDRVAALPTLASLLDDKEPKRVAIASQLLSIGFSVKLGDALAPGAVPASVGRSLLDGLARLPLDQARRIAPATVHAAMLSGQAEALFSTIAARRDPELERVAYRRLMVHGRLAPLARIKQAADGSDAQLAGAALEALRNMPSWSEAEQDVLCAFAEPYFMGADTVRSARAAQALASCTGKHVDTLLARAAELKSQGRLDGARLLPVLGVCKRPADVASGHCAKTLAFLEGVLADRAAPPQLRVSALTAIIHQTAGDNDRIDDTSPAPELLRRVLDSYASDPSPELAKHAQRMGAHFAAVSAAKAPKN